MLVKRTQLKDKAVEIGLMQRNEVLRTNEEFIQDFDALVEAVMYLVIMYQDDKHKKTLVPSEWSAKTINKVTDLKRKRVRSV